MKTLAAFLDAHLLVLVKLAVCAAALFLAYKGMPAQYVPIVTSTLYCLGAVNVAKQLLPALLAFAPKAAAQLAAAATPSPPPATSAPGPNNGA